MLVKIKDLFNLYLRVSGLERRIEAGNFMLADTMTMPEIAESLQNALFEEALITIPEGFRAEEIADLRAKGIPTVPTTIGLERATNPFVRPDSVDLQSTIGMSGDDVVAVFAETRKRKDNF